MPSFRITSISINTPTFDDDIALLIENEEINISLQREKSNRQPVSRSSVINLLVRRAADKIKINQFNNRKQA